MTLPTGKAALAHDRLDLEIRAMREGDLDAAMALAATLPTAPRWSAAAWRAALDPAASPQRMAWVGCRPDPLQPDPLELDPLELDPPRLAGFAIASLLPPDAELESLCVAKQWQRRGIGGHLLQAMGRELAARGLTSLLLEVRASNQPALALYRRVGFVEDGRRPKYYADPEEDGLLMRWSWSAQGSGCPRAVCGIQQH